MLRALRSSLNRTSTEKLYRDSDVSRSGPETTIESYTMRIPRKPLPDSARQIQDNGQGLSLQNLYECSSVRPPIEQQWTWLNKIVIGLAIFSTLFSGMFLGVAVYRPRWGYSIGPQGRLPYNTATLSCVLISKAVELAFATTFVAFLGQVLSMRAIQPYGAIKTLQGLSMADINMKLWVLQPGTLLTHFAGVRYVLPSLLGMSTLVATLGTTFYTTAAQSLVSPKLKLGKVDEVPLYGEVSAPYADISYLRSRCDIPVTTSVDENNPGSLCLQLFFAAFTFRDWNAYLGDWAEIQTSQADVAENRPLPHSNFYPDITASGQWVSSLDDFVRDSDKWGRLIHNTSLAMPHANLYNAARSERNRIIQPADLDGAGEYYIDAAVPAPAVNVLCAGATSDELKPLIGNETHHATGSVTSNLQDIFQWVSAKNSSYDTWPQPAPWFGKFPIDYNTVSSVTTTFGTSTLWVLGKPNASTIANSPYILCGIRSFQNPDCTTSYHLSQIGGELTVHCGTDPENTFPYSRTPSAQLPRTTRLLDPQGFELAWKDVGVELSQTLPLGIGLTDSNASLARMLTQMIPPWNPNKLELPTNLPLIGESLAVMAANTLLASSQSAPFVDYWNYSTDLNTTHIVQFPVQLSYKDYTSGPQNDWEGLFYVVLTSVFLQSAFCLVFIVRSLQKFGEFVDLTEPQNLFTLAMSSPPSRSLEGSCGGGPTTSMLGKKFHVANSWEIPEEPLFPHSYVQFAEDTTPQRGTDHLCTDDREHWHNRLFTRSRSRSESEVRMVGNTTVSSKEDVSDIGDAVYPRA